MASLALVPAAVIGYFSYLEARREIIDEKVYDMKQISKLRLGSVSTRIEDLKAHATRFAESQAAAGFINLPSYENFPSRLVERLSRNGFQGGAVLGLSGNLLAAADMANYDFSGANSGGLARLGPLLTGLLAGRSSPLRSFPSTPLREGAE